MARVLILGATGYVGRRLAIALAAEGHTVRALVRDRSRVDDDLAASCEIVVGDVLKPETLPVAFNGVTAVYYLIHSMMAGKRRFEQLDRRAAEQVALAAAAGGVERIIYLGGLGKRTAGQSSHLRSRHEVGDILRAGGIPVTEFRAAVIIGAGNVSFEMVHHLTNRLPVMICPRWVNTPTQPIAVEDVLRYLKGAVEREDVVGRVIDIGGPDVMTYREMMETVARVLGLRRMIVTVPVLTPRLSSYWVDLVTPIPAAIARSLIESLRSETVVESPLARELYAFAPMPFELAVRRALSRDETPPEAKTPGGAEDRLTGVDASHLLTDCRRRDTAASPQDVFSTVAAIGGETGWYHADWLWRLRGAIDRLLGGVGMRRGRRHPTDIAAGDVIDFWRVERCDEPKRLLLRAEMRVWGKAWLEFTMRQRSDGGSQVTQTAYYYPRGLFGLLYWYSIYPIHFYVFRGMIRAIIQHAEAQSDRRKTNA